ncbi:hypothetical protein K2Q00_00070 [Patescibacteria group bacterium]|nr:hypothetical protein [Patescibacteria group bacterium]
MHRPFLYRRSTWRGRYADLWTLPHVISGFFIAYVTYLMPMEYGSAFWMTFSIGIGWELLERITRLSRTEAYTNSLSDIVGAQLGFVAGWWLFAHITNPAFASVVILLLCALFCLVCLFGYRAFKYYG